MPWLAGLAIVFILGLSLGLGLLIVYLVRREGPTESGLDWDAAERAARKDDGTEAGGTEGGDDADDRGNDRDDRQV